MKNKSNIGLTIPCHWDKDIIKEILEQQGDVMITEVYGALADGGPVAHGRAKNSVKNISREDAIDFRKWLSDKGINFTYLLNAPFKFRDKQHEEDVRDYISWILNELRPDALTIASLDLMKFVREIDPTINIHISTVAGVRNVEDLRKFLDIMPNRIVPHHDVGKRWADLKALSDFCKKNNIEIELLATESCIFKCPLRDSHYLHLANRCADDKFHTNCNYKKIKNPREFLLSGGLVRPEDTSFYETLGVRYFKITGRSKPESWLPEVAKAYSERNYDGNLIRLLGIDPSLKAEDWIYIDNKSLDGFIEGFPQTGTEKDENEYADRWMIKLYNENKIRLSDGTKYKVENNELQLDEVGVEADKVIEHENPFKIKIS